MMWNMPLPVLAVEQPGRTIQRIAARHNTRAGIDAAVRGGGNIPEGIGPAASAGRRVGAQLVFSAMIASWRRHVRRTNDVRTREHLAQSRFGRGWKVREIRPAPIQLRANFVSHDECAAAGQSSMPNESMPATMRQACLHELPRDSPLGSEWPSLHWHQ